MASECPCCGYRTLAATATGESMQLCEVCGWEDSDGRPNDAMYHHGGNELRLVEAQAAFASTGASSPLFDDAIRPPRSDEARRPGWRTIAERRATIADEIERAFAGVTLGKGRSLYDAELEDSYGHVGSWLTPEHARVEARWEDITEDKLRLFPCGGPIVFLDHLGFRFYLPAYMRHAFGLEVNIDAVMFRLGRAEHAAALRALLTPAQIDVVRAWLELVVVATNGYDELGARDALRTGGWR